MLTNEEIIEKNNEIQKEIDEILSSLTPQDLASTKDNENSKTT